MLLRPQLAENNGMLTARRLLELLKVVNEVVLDGMKPSACDVTRKQHPIMRLWERVGQSISIIANDFPDADLASLGLAFEKLEPKYRQIMEKNRPPLRAKPTTIESRLGFLIEKIDKGDEGAVASALTADVYVLMHVGTIQPNRLPATALRQMQLAVQRMQGTQNPTDGRDASDGGDDGDGGGDLDVGDLGNLSECDLTDSG
jgi:hypothetical protein